MKKRIISVLLAAVMCLVLALPAFATNADIPVNGNVGSLTVGPGSSYDITTPTSVNWYLDAKTGVANVINGPTTATAVLSQIKNNLTTDPVNVEFLSFTGTNTAASTVAPELDLFFDGDLGTHVTANLENDYSVATSAGTIAASSSMTLGFKGTFDFGGTVTVPTSGYTPTYTITMGFSL